MSILENTSLFFIVAIIVGLLYPNFAEVTSSYIILFFIIAVTLSLTHLKIVRKDIKKNASSSVKAVLLSYGLLSGFILLMSYLFIQNPDHLAGYIILAAAPPAVAVIPFTYLLGGNSKVALGGELLNYMLALIFAPIITLLLLGSAVNVFEIMKILALIIVLPLILSRMLLRHLHSYDSLQKIVVNFCFGFINYSVIGLNQTVIFSEPFLILPILAVNFIAVFAPGLLVYMFGRKTGVPKERCIPYTLFGSIKNGGMTATLAILLISPASSLPAALQGPFTVGFFILLEYILKR